jgi:hypothetical protein
MDRGEKSPQVPVERWEQTLINDYYDHRWRRIIEPLCDELQRWKDGKASHADMDQVLETTHRQICEVRNLFDQRQDRLVLLIQWLDREWFEAWVRGHAPPKGARLAPPLD